MLNKNKDTIKDFSVADDTLQLENSVFKKFVVGQLKADNFTIATKASDNTDFLILGLTQLSP